MNIKEQGKEEVFASWAEFGKSNAFRKLSAFQNAIFNNNFSIA